MDDFAMSTSDLILCANLLHADARQWEQMSEREEHQAILTERAEDRRRLARKMIAEVNRRDSVRAGTPT